ncbi:uncharacterized protein LOC132629840 isoform X2 [Lycium barbarum]|nr:uncharacterized protein LOC132629840 isoform X2 [Lycium barbarum]XP_060201209.1 uncharacterized protein LOC132629840 isoform X2 [Lycium barbarum]XP_060201210.1 uncharacterized protein LOC132629840 isoform X2 [Lycium barbarum]
MHAEEESKLKASPQHALNYPPVASRRSRQNLTEEEKEERRLCRVLANRESARQTIRRRQAMYEELTRKADDLASENEYLKKQKELAAKEYDSLMNVNTSLRIQIAKIEKAKVEETDGGSKSKPVEISTTNTAPTPTPTPLFNQSPITPFFWPSIVQPFSCFFLQCGSQNISDITSVLPSPTSVDLNSINGQESTAGNPLYVLPFPCLIPYHPQSNPFHPCSSTLTENHPEASSVHQCSTPYPNMENNQAATLRDYEAALGFPPDGGASKGSRQPSGVHSREVGPMTGTSGQTDTPQDNALDINTVSEKTSQESLACSSEKLVDAIAATEARKRRKELLKLKGQHSDHGSHHRASAE